jgi:LacI family transcriptional regulator
MGHRNIIYAEFDIYQLPSTLSDRYLGFYKAMREYAVDFPEKNRLHLDIHDADDIRTRLGAVFAEAHRPTAVFFVDDYLAARCTGVLAELGLASPAEISVIAAGEVLDYDEPYIPRITTMRTNPALLGKFSAEMVFSMLESEQECNHVLKIKQQLVDRGSCRPPDAMEGV